MNVDRRMIVTGRTEESLIEELSRLLHKIHASEELVRNAEAYYAEKHVYMSDGVASYFRDMLERKRDMIAYEWDRVDKLGQAIHAGRTHGFGEL